MVAGFGEGDFAGHDFSMARKMAMSKDSAIDIASSS
jgi:hypothetical protein